MERVLTVEQMRNTDNFNIEKLGISNDVLVQRAGHAVAEEIIKRFRGGRVLVCVGKGNNGADGKIVAEILSKVHGFTVFTLNVFNGIFKVFDNKFDIIVDCIFGTGLNRLIEGKYFEAIKKINESGAFVVSCDIPSGLNGDNGTPMGICVKANLTVTIQEYKLGHFLNYGKDYCGQIISKDIGLSVWEDDTVLRFTDDELAKFFPKLQNNVHKGCFGKACVFGGSKKFPGSVILSHNALTALKMGCGYSNLAIPECLFRSLSIVNPECTVTVLPDNGEFLVYSENILERLLSYDAISFGMGVGVTEDNYQILSYLIKNYKGRLIIDADGLNTLATYGLDLLNERQCEVVLTPHIGEFCRLSGLQKDYVLENTVSVAKEFAKKYNVVLALKNAVTVITDGVKTFINTTGCPGMAKAGSGDVLSGIIAGLSCKEVQLVDSAAGACYLFGLAGESSSKKLNDYTMTASDIIREIATIISKIM